jgi:hypothetical protein
LQPQAGFVECAWVVFVEIESVFCGRDVVEFAVVGCVERPYRETQR